MDIVINLQPIYDFLNLPIDVMAWKILWNVGWLPVALTFLWGAVQLWLFYIQKRWKATHKFILLAIDIPRGNLQSPKAVENVFAYLAGAHSTQDLYEKWWLGEFQLTFSFEIVSIDGYTQFLIRTPVQFRNLVESAIYSQYPDAEITEVNDYIEGYPTHFPDELYDIWGTEFIQSKKSFYPIKIYKDFEHAFGEPETQYKDPMATLMDLMSSLRKGEQIWYQIIIKPIGTEWSDEAEKEVKKVIGEKVEAAKNFIDLIIDKPIEALGKLGDFFFPSIVESKKEVSLDEKRFLMMTLKPKQKRQIEAIQDKVGKLGFGVKIRFVYLARKEVMNKSKSANGFVGYIKQFNTNDLNSLKPDVGARGTATKVNYPIFAEARLSARKRKLMFRYKTRDVMAGRTPGIFNIEELATIWHFPVESVVKAPLIQKAPGRKAEPPSGLPVSKVGTAESFFAPTARTSAQELFAQEIENWGAEKSPDNLAELGKGKASPPANLPIV